MDKKKGKNKNDTWSRRFFGSLTRTNRMIKELGLDDKPTRPVKPKKNMKNNSKNKKRSM